MSSTTIFAKLKRKLFGSTSPHRPDPTEQADSGDATKPEGPYKAYNPPFEPMLQLLKTYNLDDFAAPSKWGGGQQMESGAIQMPYVICTPAQDAFREAACSWQRHIDWMSWGRTEVGESMRSGKQGSIEGASKEDIGALLTAVIRNDRFCEGAFAAFCEEGYGARVLKRIQVLYEEERVAGYAEIRRKELRSGMFNDRPALMNSCN